MKWGLSLVQAALAARGARDYLFERGGGATFSNISLQ